MRVLLLSHSPNDPDGGASRVYHLLAGELGRRGHGVVLRHLEDFRLPSGRLPNLLVRRTLLPRWIAGAVRRDLDLASFDLVMSSSGVGCALYAALRRRADRPVLVNHFHGLAIYDDLAAREESHLGYWPASPVYKLVTGPAQVRWDAAGAARADHTIVQNLRDLSLVERWLPPGTDVPLIPPSVHPGLIEASARIRPPAERDRNRILWFGSWEPRKGSARVGAAFRQIRARHPGATLTIGGTGRPAAEIQAAFDAEDRASVTVLPRVSLDEQVRLFNEAAIFLFPSLSEGFGLAVMEAMCFGAAAVTTSTGFGGDHMTDGVHGRVVPPTSRHVAAAVTALIEDDAGRARMAESGRALARGFTTGRMGDAYARVLEGFLARRRGAREGSSGAPA